MIALRHHTAESIWRKPEAIRRSEELKLRKAAGRIARPGGFFFYGFSWTCWPPKSLAALALSRRSMLSMTRMSLSTSITSLL